MKSDVVISGGGLVGSLLAILLAKKNWDITVVDPQKKLPHHDGRVLAINAKSITLLKEAGIELIGESIRTICAYEEGSAWTLRLNSSDTPTGADDLALMVHYEHLRQQFMQQREKYKNIHFIEGKIASIQRMSHLTKIVISNDSIVETPLLIGAEGAQSPTRTQYIGIRTKTFDYGEHALVFHVEHFEQHNGQAFEIFRPNGPIAILPMISSNQSCIVWNTQTPDLYKNLDDQDLANELQKLFSLYGGLKVISQRWIHPLKYLSVSHYAQHRYALVGDAAHVLHPLAGQGVNLGWRDASCLADTLCEARYLGLDWGDITALKPYETKQKSDHTKLRLAVNGLHRLFQIPYGTTFRGLGIGILNRIPAARKTFVRHAMGL